MINTMQPKAAKQSILKEPQWRDLKVGAANKYTPLVVT